MRTWHSAHHQNCVRAERRRTGTATIEMILVFPMLLTLVLGMVEFGLFFYTKSVFQSATRDAARSACTAVAIQADPATAAARTFGYSHIAFDPTWMSIVNDATATTVTDVSQIVAGQAFTITIQQTYGQIPGTYRPLYSMTGVGIGTASPVIGKCTMIKE